MRLTTSLALLSSLSFAEPPLKNPIPEPEAKYNSEDLEIIPISGSATASKGYAYKLKNSSFRRKNEKLYLEFGLTVEGPPQ